jgi:hypothetical protein
MVLRKSSYKQIKDQANKRKLQQSYPNKAHTHYWEQTQV